MFVLVLMVAFATQEGTFYLGVLVQWNHFLKRLEQCLIPSAGFGGTSDF